ncbi:EFHD2 protein, partial [Polyodon spathula]|nr:EFHD2 protein [Polyodon spathula]
MASDELASKLTRRLKIEEGAEEPVSLSGTQDGLAGRSEEEKPATANADSELGAKLLRRTDINDGVAEHHQPSKKVFNPYTEFKEFSRKQIKDMEKMFKQYDAGKDGFIDLMELKLMMEKLGAPQTHLGLKNMIKEVDEDFDGKLSFRECNSMTCFSIGPGKGLGVVTVYDAGKDGFIDLMELKLMMEKLGAPQTHLGLKNMIKEVDEDFDGKLSFREFLLIFRKAAAGELPEDSGLHVLARLSEIDVSTEGVKGAKTFFEAKVRTNALLLHC